jgi:hypothetical protein
MTDTKTNQKLYNAPSVFHTVLANAGFYHEITGHGCEMSDSPDGATYSYSNGEIGKPTVKTISHHRVYDYARDVFVDKFYVGDLDAHFEEFDSISKAIEAAKS